MFRLRIINCSSNYTEPGIQSLGCEILDTAAPGPAELITEPPLTFDFSNADLEKCSMGEDLLFPDIPCHSQNVERAVACTTKVAETVVGYTKRHAHILLLNKSRQKISKNATKKRLHQLKHQCMTIYVIALWLPK